MNIPTLPTQDSPQANPSKEALENSNNSQMAATLTSTFGGYLNTVTKNVKSDINPRNFMFNIERNILALLQS